MGCTPSQELLTLGLLGRPAGVSRFLGARDSFDTAEPLP
jgi:hypothetical protein